MNEKFLIPGRWWSLVILALALQACATITPDELSQRLYKADRALTESVLLANGLHAKGQISENDWPKVMSGFEDASSQLDKAWAAYDKDPKAAAKSISSFEAILEAVNGIHPEMGQAQARRLKWGTAPASSTPAILPR